MIFKVSLWKKIIKSYPQARIRYSKVYRLKLVISMGVEVVSSLLTTSQKTYEVINNQGVDIAIAICVEVATKFLLTFDCAVVTLI